MNVPGVGPFGEMTVRGNTLRNNDIDFMALSSAGCGAGPIVNIEYNIFVDAVYVTCLYQRRVCVSPFAGLCSQFDGVIMDV